MIWFVMLFGGAIASALAVVFLKWYLLIVPAVLLGGFGTTMWITSIDYDTPAEEYVPHLICLVIIGALAPWLLLTISERFGHQGAGILGLGWVVYDFWIFVAAVGYFVKVLPRSRRWRR